MILCYVFRSFSARFQSMTSRIFSFLIAFSLTLQACKVPVFRYALERWQNESYTLRVNYEVKLDSAVEAELIRLSDLLNKKSKPLNLILEPTDVSSLPDSLKEKIDRSQDKSFPSLALYPPSDKTGLGARPIHVSNLTLESLQAVIDSPARRGIVRSLLAGESAVWVMIKSGDPESDAAARKALFEGIEEAQQILKISDEVVPKSELDTEQKKREVDLDDVLYSAIPLKISFAVLELDVDDAEEKVFIDMLTKGLSRNKFVGKCLAAPIFGRGRCLGVTVGDSITAESIFKSCEQICGECSCTVKSQSPGYDIVLNADWQSHVDTSPIMVDKVIPDLTGAGDFIDQSNETYTLEFDPSDITSSASEVPESSAPSTFDLLKWVGILLGLVIALAAASMIILNRRDER